MTHDYHQGPEDAVLYDGCAECDRRAADPLDALLNLDGDSYRVLRERMQAVEFGGDRDRYRSANEAKVGRAMYYIALLEQRNGPVLP